MGNREWEMGNRSIFLVNHYPSYSGARNPVSLRKSYINIFLKLKLVDLSALGNAIGTSLRNS